MSVVREDSQNMRGMNIICNSTEEALAALSVVQLKKICLDIGIPYGHNHAAMAKDW